MKNKGRLEFLCALNIVTLKICLYQLLLKFHVFSLDTITDVYLEFPESFRTADSVKAFIKSKKIIFIETIQKATK